MTAQKLSGPEKLWLIVADPELASINAGLLVLVGIAAFMGWYTSGALAIVAGGVLLAALATGAYLVRVGWATFDNAQAVLARAQAREWARAATTAEERRNRMESIALLGAAGALTAAGVQAEHWTPAFNVDGTPMIDGTSMDYNGHVFGQTDSDEMMFDVDPVHVELGDGYHNPIGSDPSEEHTSF